MGGYFCFSGYQIYSYYSEQNASTSLNQEIVREYTIRKTGEAKEYFEVDFDQLRQQNEDVTAWLYLPDSVINYPVLQHGDNDYYLTRQIDGSYNKNGSIFMDYRNASDFSDRNTIIYGHHMRTGNMFGKLVNFKKRQLLSAARSHVHHDAPGHLPAGAAVRRGGGAR